MTESGEFREASEVDTLDDPRETREVNDPRKAGEVDKMVEVGAARISWARAPDAATRRATGRHPLAGLLTDAGLEDDVIQQWRRCGATAHGPVHTASGRAGVSVSYAADLAVAAIARTTKAVALGVDVERERTSGSKIPNTPVIPNTPDTPNVPLTELAALFAPAPPSIRK